MSGFAQINQMLGGGYAGLPFGGTASPEELGQLIKALSVGADRDPPGAFTPGDGFAFRVEDLDPLMRVSTFDMTNIVFWKLLQKSAAENTVVEWNDTEQYGEDGYDGFIQDGGLPELMDSTVSRQYAFIKFLGVQAAVTHGSTLVKSANGNLVAGETERKTMKLLELVERSLLSGNSALDPVQWDGIFTQMDTAVAAGRAGASLIQDLRGANLTVEDIENGTAESASEPNWARLTDLLCNPLVKSDMAAGLIPSNRGEQGVGSTNGGIGADFEYVNTSIGKVNVHPSAFVPLSKKASLTGQGDASRRPGTPVLSTGMTSPVSATSQFIATDVGDYGYYVVARNRYGASVPLDVGTTTVAAGDKITFGVTPAAGNTTLYFEFYRSTKNGGVVTRDLITRVVNPAGGFAEVVFSDDNADLPGTSKALVMQLEPRVLGFKQLAPFMKISLAQIDLNYRWVQCVYGTPVLYMPKKIRVIKNIGRRTA